MFEESEYTHSIGEGEGGTIKENEDLIKQNHLTFVNVTIAITTHP